MKDVHQDAGTRYCIAMGVDGSRAHARRGCSCGEWSAMTLTSMQACRGERAQDGNPGESCPVAMTPRPAWPRCGGQSARPGPPARAERRPAGCGRDH